MSWGSNQKIDKFYKGAQSDTPWNKDLLWRYHVSKESKQAKVQLSPHRSPTQQQQPRMKMGITGTLIPDITPRYDAVGMERGSLTSSSGRRLLGLAPQPADMFETQSVASRARSHRSSASSSSLSSSSSLGSIRMNEVQEILENQSRLLKEKTSEEINVMRYALLEEARKREAAEKKIHYLCEKLGIDDQDL
ncbi:TPA: hypothetical protein N0F65_006908 [Lagenidium giganteum]|uniref:Uncharacterized protein n=1 Tax=Lagenidium giganteum TaxID=4803 RepID=A0AAV2ZFU1_9STRA|nr:TPA: hypothetical protein N0F65_006908 [Lagenidium giganteum]